MKPNKRLLTGLARSMYPKEPQLTPEEKARVEEEVVNYLDGQILALPTYLRFPYGLALHAFNWLSCLGYGLPFTRIDREKQANYVLVWSRSPIGLMRDFIKLIRSLVLLSYLDHPVVLQELELNIMKNAGEAGA